MVCACSVFGLSFVVQYLVSISGFAIILMGKKAASITLIVFLRSSDCWCSVAVPNDALDWFAVCGCCIS